MASAKSPFAEQENLSAIYPVHNVRNLSGSDRHAPLPFGPAPLSGALQRLYTADGGLSYLFNYFS